VREHDAEGRTVVIPRETAAAATAWAEVVKISDEDEYRLSLARALLRADKVADAEAAARIAAPSDARDALVVAASAAGNPATGINVATGLRTGAARTTLLQKASVELFIARHYPALMALQLEAGTLRAGTAEAALFQRVARHDARFEVGKDPAKIVADLLLSVVDGRHRPTSLWSEDSRKDVRKGLQTYATQMAAIRTLPSGALRDLVLSGLVSTVNGPVTGPWRVEAEYFGKKLVVYAALFGKEAKLIGMPDSVAGVGRYAFQRIEAGDRAAAHQLMAWLHADIAAVARASKLLTIWGGSVPTDDKALSVAAAIMAFGSASDRAVPVLAKCESAPDVRPMCDMALALQYEAAQRWKELEAHAVAWHAREPTATFSASFLITALLKLKRYDEADAVALTSSKDPNDHDVLVKRASIASTRRDVPEAARRFDALVKSASAKAMDKNNFAWWMLGEKRDLKLALELAQAALRDSSGPEILNTLAAIEAELGDVSLARAHTIKAIEARQDDVPDAADWYVIGRMYEQLGLRTDAIAAYKRIKTPDAFFPSSKALAVDRLKVLGAP
jgi:tetratricopeptide (TPR) repeat protein